MTNQSDPLDGADIGDSETVTVTRELWLGDLEADAAKGSDRSSESEVIATEVVTDEFGEEYLAVSVRSDITKRLPRNWDYSQAPRTETERKQARREKWKRRVAGALPLAGVLGLSFAIAMRVMNTVAGKMTINGEPMGPPPMLPAAGIMLLVVVISLGLQYLPGGHGGPTR